MNFNFEVDGKFASDLFLYSFKYKSETLYFEVVSAKTRKAFEGYNKEVLR
jgi:hypothetical protein